MIPMAVIFFISSLAETNRPPFDLPEAESELVAGYQVEYSSTPYLLFMLAEYANIVLMCALISVLFFGGWQAPFPTPFTGALDADRSASLFGFVWFAVKIVFFFFMFAHGQGHRAPLPLRPADAPGLEGVPADLAGRRGRCLSPGAYSEPP